MDVTRRDVATHGGENAEADDDVRPQTKDALSAAANAAVNDSSESR